MTEAYRLTELARAKEQAAVYRQRFDTLPKGTDERIQASDMLNFWQGKVAFLHAMRLHTETAQRPL